MHYYNPITKQYAKVLSLDHKTDTVMIEIDGVVKPMDWNEFLSDFKTMIKVSK